MHCTRVLVLIVLLVELVHSFSWDIVVGGNKQLEFYYNGTLMHIEVIPPANSISSVTYDPVHYRVLFTDYKHSTKLIYSFDLSTKKIQCLVMRTTRYYSTRVVYDPVTKALYWKEGSDIYWFSLNPVYSNKADGNLLDTLDHYCWDIAVDSCGGYIYWITDYEIGRVRLDGSKREVLIKSTVSDRISLAIDQQTQKMYWTEKNDYQVSIESANLNGKNRTTLHIVRSTRYAFSLAISKDFIYWQNYNEQGIWHLPKYSSQTVARKLHSMSSSDCWHCHRIAANYTIKKQIQGIKNCDALQSLIPYHSKSESSLCQNYCLQGECSVSAEGKPTCRCKAGYSGERCEVNPCHDFCLHGGVCSLNEKNKRVCQCTAGYDGERCEVFICNEYCLQGNCNAGAEGQPKCSCMTGYTGKRCEVNACYRHCLNGGVCYLNEEDKPVCACTAGYSGERCDVSICNEYCLQGNCNVGAEGQPKCSCMTGYTGKRCEVNACYRHCLNSGVCYLNEEDKPVCACTAGYSGERCDVSICNEYCLQGNCNVGAEGQPKCSCMVGYSGERCEVNACHDYCLHGGVCFLNEEDEPACQCTADYDGGRCEISANKDNSCDAGNYGKEKVSACHQFCLNNGACSLNEEREPVCQCTADYEGERCEVSVNEDISFHASCSVNAEGQPKVIVTLGHGV